MSEISLHTWLESSLYRMEHLLFIHDNPDSVQAGFGPEETMNALREELPQIRARLVADGHIKG